MGSFRNKDLVRIHAIGGILLAINWLAFIYAVTHEQVLQASLAYFMVPLVNSCFGFLVLKERLSILRGAAILLAGTGVLNEIVQVSEVPRFALIIAASFGSYGLLKKKTSLGTVTGLTLENTVIFPMAFLGLIAFFLSGGGALGNDTWKPRCL